MPRSFVVVIASLAMVVTAFGNGTRRADASDCGPSASVAAAGSAVEAAGRSAGSIDGKVSDIDYRGSRMTVTAGKRCYDILVQPSTSIVGKGKDFYEIADIKRGARVEVLLSEKAGAYIAQIIHLL